MNLLDKLFSREIERRTGEHAVKIYIESQSRQKRARSIGATAIKASQKSRQATSKSAKSAKTLGSAYPPKGTFLHRLDVRFPWLKLATVCLVGIIVILDLCDVTISHTTDPQDTIRIAPMRRHVRATERTLEGKKLVALTFDDGPMVGTTPQLLKVLHDKDVPATFFMLGNMARQNPELVKEVQKAGHEVASHTMYHQNLVRIPANAVESDVNESKTVFQNILGQPPALTRPPYGNINDIVRTQINTPMILWSVDTLDWKNKNTNSIINTTMDEVYDGAIILMHDIYQTSIDAAPKLIDTLRQNNYEFVTVSELAKIRNIKLTSGTAYYNFTP